MKENLGKKGIVIGVIFIVVCTSVVSAINKNTKNDDDTSLISVMKTNTRDDPVPITFSIIGKTGITKQTTDVTRNDAVKILDLFSELKDSITTDPLSKKTEQLKREFFSLLKENNVIPKGISNQQLLSLLQSPVLPFTQPPIKVLPLQTKASEWFCNFASYGEGSAFPIIILPRFIPFILAPIPRAFVYWATNEGLTSVGGLISKTGFLAGGKQQGIALGFWGIGFSVFLPPIMSYGILGYALYTRVNAQEIEFWPPNNEPEITQTDPVNGQEMVSMSTSELRFIIQDADKDFMSFNVTTQPNIGSGSGGLKPDGIYSIPVSGLESLTEYTWYIQVTDGKDTVNKMCSFTTEPAAPIILNPLPKDGERDVPIDFAKLKFTIKDYQGDAMSYTVETSPNIGSGSGTAVHNGTYEVSISNLEIASTYRWYINLTDGSYWVRKALAFETGYPSQFNPFEYGWHYRKQITIDHTKVSEDLTHFPVLLSTTDTDLSQKAQTDGGDIMFMNDIGVSTRIYHDLESYDASSGALVAWVDIPSLSSTTDTVLYMYYGNPSCINQSYPEKTWDPNFEAVWHMNDATPTTIPESTSHQYTGTKLSPYEPKEGIGKIGPGQDFDGTDGYLQFTQSIIPVGSKTISAWINRYSTQWKYAVILTSSTGISSNDAGTSWSFLDGSNTLECVLGNGHASGHFMKVSAIIPDTNSWHYYTMTYDGTTLSLYIDGELVDLTTSKSGTEEDPTYNLRMGKTNHPSYTYFLNAGLDEIQISNVVRSDAWIQTSYDMMVNPSLFLTIGSEVPGP